MKTDCTRYEPELSAYIDGETDPAFAAEIEAHTAACRACAAGLARLGGVSRALRRWDAHETRYAASTGLRNRVLAKLGVAERAGPGLGAWRAAAAAALVAAGAGTYALVAPRIGREPAADGAVLEALAARLERAILERGAPAPAAPSRDTAAIPRVEPLGPVVARPAPDDTAPAPARAPEVWEQRGDERILRDALPSFDTFASERRSLALEEEIREMREMRVARDESPTSAPKVSESQLATFFGELRVASANYSSFEGLQVWPIELAQARARDAALLTSEEAIAKDILSVTEGSVRETVVAVNSDPRRPVLVMAGDVLAGSDQDRVVREDVLVGPGQRISIPVYSCGRAQRTSYRRFTHSDGVAVPEIRALVAADRALFGGAIGQAVFDEAVGRSLQALASPGGQRGSLDSLFRNPELGVQTDRKVRSFLKRLDSPTVVGFAFSAGSRVLGVDVFGDHASLVEHRLRVLRSYVMSAIALDRLDGASPSREDVAAIVANARAGAFHAGTPTGSDSLSVFRAMDAGAFGTGLLDGSRVVHAVLFTSVPGGGDSVGARGGRRLDEGGTPLDGGREGGSGSRGDAGGGGDGVEPR